MRQLLMSQLFGVLLPLLFLLGMSVLASSCTCEGNEQGHRIAPAGGDLRFAPAERRPYDERARQECGALGATPESEQLLRGPYLQSVTNASAVIVWTSENAQLQARLLQAPLLQAPGRDLETVQGQLDESASPARGAQFTAGFADLSPNTLYCYEILEAERVLWRGALATAPGPDATIHFSAMGDVGKDSGDQRAVREQLQTLESEFLLILGDVAYDSGTLAQFEKYFFAVYRPLLALIPVFPASGNHDYETAEARAFREVFVLPRNGEGEGVERWYSFDWGPAHLVVLDTQHAMAEQVPWLRADLEANALPWVIVALHKAPFASGTHGSDAEVQEHFVPVFEELGVDLVLAGHEHHYERTEAIRGVHYVVSGGGGRGTRPVGSSAFTVFSARVAHFVSIELDPETLTLHAIDASGAEFDSMQLSK